MANRLTYFSQNGNGERLMSKDAKMYSLSAALFGDYGGKGPHGRDVREKWRETVESWRRRRDREESSSVDTK